MEAHFACPKCGEVHVSLSLVAKVVEAPVEEAPVEEELSCRGKVYNPAEAACIACDYWRECSDETMAMRQAEAASGAVPPGAQLPADSAPAPGTV